MTTHHQSKLLTRAEEYVLLAVLKLEEEAYSLPIQQFVERITGKNWTLGGIYIPLYRLEDKGFLKSNLGDPTRERGGKRKRFYSITTKGKTALKAQRRIERAILAELEKEHLD